MCTDDVGDDQRPITDVIYGKNFLQQNPTSSSDKLKPVIFVVAVDLSAQTKFDKGASG